MKKLLFSFLLFVCSAVAADKIGHVVAVEGVLRAIGLEQGERALRKNSAIFLGDLLITEEIARGQVKFTDGTLLLLIPGTRYSVDAYAESHLVGKNEYAGRLTQGGVRVSTGLIAKKNPENFEVGTPNATIGVRGTVFEARVMGGDLFVGSSSGDLSVKNQGGTLDIGSKNENSFAMATSEASAPQPLAQRPDALNLADFAVPAGGISFGGAPTASAAGVTTGASAASGFAWGPAIGGLTVFGTVVGVVAGTSSQSSSTFSHAAAVVVATIIPPTPPPDSNFSH